MADPHKSRMIEFGPEDPMELSDDDPDDDSYEEWDFSEDEEEDKLDTPE
jgi:hypothetical protein